MHSHPFKHNAPSCWWAAARVMKLVAVLAAAAITLSLASAAHAATASFSLDIPTLGADDISNLLGTDGTDYTNGVSRGDSAYIASNQAIVGQTFTTGSNPFGYLLNSITLREVTHPTYCEVYDMNYTIRITSPAGASLSVLASETCAVPNGTPGNIPTIYPLYAYLPGSGTFITFTFDSPWVLAPNTTYGFDVGGGSGYYYWETDGTNGNVYAGGSAYSSGLNGVGDTTLTQQTGDRVFVAGLTALTSPFAPFIASQPQPKTLFPGRTARFGAAVGGSLPLSYQWRKNGSNIFDNDNISGATNITLVVNNLSATDGGIYTLVVTNSGGATTSAPVTLTVLSAPAVGTYAHTALSNNPVAQWRLGEAGDPTTGTLIAFDYAGGRDGIYGSGCIVGEAGPRPSSFPGLESGNNAVQTSKNNGTPTWVKTPGLNLTGNHVTFTAWIRPNANQADATGLVMTRAGTSAGLNYSSDNQIGYIWNQGADQTWGFASGLRPPAGEWSFVAMVIEPSRATLYLGTNGTLKAAVNAIPHTTEPWTGEGQIGGDQNTIDWRIFDGLIDEVAVFDSAFSFDQISALYGSAVGSVPASAPVIVNPPQSLELFSGRTARLTAAAVGSAPLSYQWKKNAANIPGATTDSLTLTNIAANNSGDYTLVVSNPLGTATSAPPATLTVIAPAPYSYAELVNNYNPVCYWRLNEPGDPSTGLQAAYDRVGGLNATYTAGAQNAFNSKEGPRPETFTGFETNNAAVQTTGTGDRVTPTWVWLPSLPINTNAVSFTLWIKPNREHLDYNGLIMNRSGNGAGIGFTSGNQLGYTWNGGAQETWSYLSGLTPPSDEWSFVALVIDPAKAVFYLHNSAGLLSATNAIPHTSDSLEGRTQLGGDQNYADWRIFDGLIDEVAIFDYALDPQRVQSLSSRATAVALSVQKVGANLQLTWPRGTLLEAGSVTGPWSTNNAASPYSVAPSEARKFYRVIVQ